MNALLSLAAVGAAALCVRADDPATDGQGASCCDAQPDACCAAPPGMAALPATIPVVRRVTSPDGVGSVAGTMTWDGTAPDPKPALTIGDKESEGCVHAKSGTLDTTNRTLLINKSGGGIANVVVTLEVEGVELEIPDDPLLMDQYGCRFEPHVVVLPVGATLKFGNSDKVNHNIHTYSKKNQQMNKNVSGGSDFEQKLSKAETFEVKCDIHPWMKSYVVVTDATYWAITDADGKFEMKDVPPGKYKISYWHEELGKGKTSEFVVEAGAKVAVTQKLSASKKKAGGRRRR